MERKLISISPWIFAAACGLLASIIAVFAVKNYSREKALMTESLRQQGLAVIRFVDSGVMLSMRGSARSDETQGLQWVDHIQNVIEQRNDNEAILSIELINSQGIIVATTDPEHLQTRAARGTLDFIDRLSEGEIRSGIAANSEKEIDSNDNGQGFQVATIIKPRLRGPMRRGGLHDRPMLERMGRGFPPPELQRELERMHGERFTLVVELSLTEYQQVVKQRLFEIVILSIVLLLVGVGGWLSLLTLQGLRGSQSRLKELSSFNDVLVQSLPVGLIGGDSDGRVKVVNLAAQDITGLPAAEIMGKPLRELLQLIGADTLFDDLSQLSSPQSRETHLAGGDGQKKTLQLTAVTVTGSDSMFSGNVILLQDVSEIRNLEKELQRSEKMAALGKMAAGVAHELRNPLSSIKGLAILLQNRVADDGESQRNATILVAEVERLNRSITELLDFARPAQLSMEKIAPGVCFREAIELIAIDADSQGVSVETDFQDNGKLITGDGDKLKQVFLNVLLNGIQAMPHGGQLHLHSRLEGESVICEISDTGVGIREIDQPRVFDPYFTTKNSGTGLGLALSAKIVEEHGGEISLASEEGEGTRIRLSFPLAR